MIEVFEEKCRRALEGTQMPLPVTELGFGNYNGRLICVIYMDASSIDDAPAGTCSTAIVFKPCEEPTDEAIKAKLSVAVRTVHWLAFMNVGSLPV